MSERKIYTGFGFESATPDVVKQHEQRTGLEFPILLVYKSWGQGDIDDAAFTQFSQVGKTPLLTWEPWNPEHGTEQAKYSLSKIADGDHDAYIRRNALKIKGYEKPVFLRFAHEMNGDWYPWGASKNGNQPKDYVNAWNHVQDVFDDAGVNNVTWVWSPNVEYDGSSPLSKLYPGDDRVDWIGIDGYNWGNNDGHRWQSFNEVFDQTYTNLTTITSKPLLIAETASTEHGGDKAVWIRDAFEQIPLLERVNAVVWFNLDKETDWRVESTDASAQSFRKAVAKDIFTAPLKTKNGKIIPA